jgi:hypothetical protein
MLYVDGDNTAAMGLYEGLGFTVHRTKRTYTVDVPSTIGDPGRPGGVEMP